MTTRDLHRKAMENAKIAGEFLNIGDEKEYLKYTSLALEYEKQAAEMLFAKKEAEPTRSVLYRSAANLAFNCHKYEDAKILVYCGLVGNPHLEIKNELESLLAQIQEKLGRIKDWNYKLVDKFNLTYTFDNFIEGDCNRLARNAGLAVASRPGATSFNPLLIFGGVGLGKTHLVHAIGNYTKSIYNEMKVLYVSCEKFINHYYDACKDGSNKDFLNFYKNADVLIMDGVQFLSKKEKPQEAFYQIFNHLLESNRQLILTADRSAKELRDFDERLLSRFKWGLSAELQVPDFESRVMILENKMILEDINLSKDIVEYIAHHIDSSVRELHGVLIGLIAQSVFNQKEVTIELVKKVLKNFVKHSTREVSVDYIQKLVTEFYGLSIEQLKSKTRKTEIVQARQISMYYAKSMTKESIKNIGTFFGTSNLSSILQAYQTVNDLIDTDKKFKNDVEKIGNLILTGGISLSFADDPREITIVTDSDGNKMQFEDRETALEYAAKISKG